MWVRLFLTRRTAPELAFLKNLYVLSELSQYIVRDKSHQNGWSLESHDQGLRMPKSLFKQLSSKSAADVGHGRH